MMFVFRKRQINEGKHASFFDGITCAFFCLTEHSSQSFYMSNFGATLTLVGMIHVSLGTDRHSPGAYARETGSSVSESRFAALNFRFLIAF